MFAGLAVLLDYIDDDLASSENDTGTGVGVLENLTPEQKLALLADVAQALRDPTVPMPHHTAANEGAIAAVFATVHDLLTAEIETPDPAAPKTAPNIRGLLLAAYYEGDDRPDDLRNPAVFTADDWYFLLESVEERILWDCDYALGDEFLDLPPAITREHMKNMGIDPEYFLTVPREPDDAGLANTTSNRSARTK